MAKVEVKIVRYDSSNENIEALKGQWGQHGDGKATFTVIKNLLFINLQGGAKYQDAKLPSVYDGFVELSNGGRIQIKDSTLTCDLGNDVNGSGVLVLQKWN